jgi:hypothetical protein
MIVVGRSRVSAAYNPGTTMVDCFDRIAVQMTEIALEPIEQLAARPTMFAATVRLPIGGRHVLLTVRKRCTPGRSESSSSYAWQIETCDASANPVVVLSRSAADAAYNTPADAFWSAVDAMEPGIR